MSEKRILVALSGGVDSAVAAGLLVAQGVPVAAAYMKNWINEDGIIGDCPWEQDVGDARAIAQHLGIDFEVVNLMDAYKARIVDMLLDGYAKGGTPNPDVFCNREIKFGVFRDWARAKGFGAVATGHYARQQTGRDGQAEILTGLDPNKDQTYFLCMMQQAQARDAVFPIGHLRKDRVRAEARRMRLPVAEKKDSQGICFIGNIRMRDFLAAYLPDEPGAIVLPNGKQIGAHQGLHFYTIGQRKGLAVASPVYGKHYVVIEKRVETRELVVALETPDVEGLYAESCILHSVSFVGPALHVPASIEARARYRAPSVPISYAPLPNACAMVRWSQPQRALAAGQICALYDGEKLLGGGIYGEIKFAK
ncbi:MAG: tRNA 2-thiouridine(34) synthase MnmA [Kiritimatiellia bacterium]